MNKKQKDKIGEIKNLDKNNYLVRLHIGLEDPNDLIKDLKKSLKHIK